MTKEDKKRIYGRTINGLDITDELIEKYVAEAEAGFDLSRLRPRPRTFVAGEALTLTFEVRVRDLIEHRAKAEQRSIEALLTDALFHYLVDAPYIDPRHEGDTGG